MVNSALDERPVPTGREAQAKTLTNGKDVPVDCENLHRNKGQEEVRYGLQKGQGRKKLVEFAAAAPRGENTDTVPSTKLITVAVPTKMSVHGNVCFNTDVTVAG